MGMGNIDIRQLKALQRKLERIRDRDVDKLVKDCAKEIAARLLSAVIPRTPVGDYSNEVIPSGKVGGTLKRGWIAKSESEASSGGEPSASEIDSHIESLEVSVSGNTFRIIVENCMNYASYVEHGHRQTPGRFVPQIGKRLKVSWIEGKHMLEISEQEVKGIAPQLLERKVSEWLRRCFS